MASLRRLGFHPSKRTLGRWLAGEADGRVDAHVGTCRRCANFLEELARPSDPALAEVLALAFAPPDNLSGRLHEQVAARLDSRVVLDVVTDLFIAGLETSRLLITEELDE
jgi:hypothetical protein